MDGGNDSGLGLQIVQQREGKKRNRFERLWESTRELKPAAPAGAPSLKGLIRLRVGLKVWADVVLLLTDSQPDGKCTCRNSCVEERASALSEEIKREASVSEPLTLTSKFRSNRR